jgi:membrane protein implicated in regulation of membrane protease activity
MRRALRLLTQLFIVLLLYGFLAALSGTIAWTLGATWNQQIGWGFIGGSLLLAALLYPLRRRRGR